MMEIMQILFIGEKKVKDYIKSIINKNIELIEYNMTTYPNNLKNNFLILQAESLINKDIFYNINTVLPLLLFLEIINNPIIVVGFMSSLYYINKYNIPFANHLISSNEIQYIQLPINKDKFKIIQHILDLKLNIKDKSILSDFYNNRNVNFISKLDHLIRKINPENSDSYNFIQKLIYLKQKLNKL